MLAKKLGVHFGVGCVGAACGLRGDEGVVAVLGAEGWVACWLSGVFGCGVVVLVGCGRVANGLVFWLAIEAVTIVYGEDLVWMAEICEGRLNAW